MDDLQTRIRALLEEIEYVHLKKTWPERLIAAGIDEKEASKWAAEIGHVVEAYETSLRYLVDLLQETDTERILRQVESWAAFTRDISVFKIEDAMQYLQGQLERYLPPEPDDDEE